MSISINSSPIIFFPYLKSAFVAYEEVITLIDHNNFVAYIFVHERRRVNSRAIIRVVDFKNKIVRDERSRTLKFTIKSTFASYPYEDEAITFTAGGFTSSLIAKDLHYTVISASPNFILPGEEKGLKSLFSFILDSSKPSINYLDSRRLLAEGVHLSQTTPISGYLRKGENKEFIKGGNYSLTRVWKKTSFPLKRDSYSSFIYLLNEDKPFSIVFSLKDLRCITLSESEMKVYENIKIEKIDSKSYHFFDGDGIDITFSIFSSLREKTGPFRKNRHLNYALSTGRISNISFSNSFSLIEL